MAVYTKEFLSGSVNGRPINVVAIATPGTLIHEAHATSKDEVWLYAVNTDTMARKLTVEFGGVTSPNDLIEVTVAPEQGLLFVVPGIVLSNNLVVRCFASAPSVINILGFINRIT